MPAEPEQGRIPFEPTKKGQAKAQKSVQKKPPTPIVKKESSPPSGKKPPFTKQEMAIPEVISKRMIKRVAFFSGIPTALGIAVLVISYFLIAYAHVQLPPLAVLLVNMGLFGLGVLGITYGVLSASWDENSTGTLVGWGDFQTNFGRMVEGWRETRKNKNAEES